MKCSFPEKNFHFSNLLRGKWLGAMTLVQFIFSQSHKTTNEMEYAFNAATQNAVLCASNSMKFEL